MTTCETCHGEGVFLCEGPYCTDNSHDEPCTDCGGSGEMKDKHNCPGLRVCRNHPKTHVFKLLRSNRWGVWRPTVLGFFSSTSFASFKDALDKATKTEGKL